jgi:hypothetical protein
MEGVILAIFSGLFMPDSTRAGRWVGCRSLQQALDSLAKRSNAEPVGADWIPVGEVEEEQLSLFGGSEAEEPCDLVKKGQSGCGKDQSDESEAGDATFELQSSASEGNSIDDHEEDEHQLEVAGKAISGLVAGAGAHDARVFRHRVSGIYHLMAGGESAPDEDGEMSSTKCGKLISHNFEEICQLESFLPTKCRRCFTQ